MLLGIDPLLDGTLLEILDHMGHGDRIAVVDRNYPAFSAERPVVQLGNVSTTRALEAIFSVIPLDVAAASPLTCMADKHGASRPSHHEVVALATHRHGVPVSFELAPRLEFYGLARAVHAVVRTLDDRPYSCFILQKGVIEDPVIEDPVVADSSATTR